MTTRHTIGTPDSLARWVLRLRNAPESARVELSRDGMAGGEVIASWTLAEARSADWPKDALQAAADDADALGARTSYDLAAVDDTGRRIASRNVRVDPSGASGGFTESATLTGLVGQLMRHNEALVKQVVLSCERSSMAMTGAMTALAERTAQLEREAARYAQELRTERLEVETDGTLALEEERKTKREEELFGLLKMGLARQAAKEAREEAEKKQREKERREASLKLASANGSNGAAKAPEGKGEA